MALDVAEDEDAIIRSVLELRRTNPMSLEAMGFLLGTGAGQISRYLNRSAGVTITNYLRIARALGYRCRIVLEKADASQPGHQPLSDLRIEPHKVSKARPASVPTGATLPPGKKVLPV